MEFINLPRSRRLVSTPSLEWTDQFKVGYEKDLDATAVEIPYADNDISLILLLPGKVSEFVVNGLDDIERKLDTKSWEQLLRTFVIRNLEMHVPLIKTHSVINMNETLISLGLKDSFSDEADFSGINGAKDLKLSSFFQVNEFALEKFTSKRRKRNTSDKVLSFLRSQRQAETYQLHFERQFMYVVRHNPTGLLLFIGRYQHPDESSDNHHHDLHDR